MEILTLITEFIIPPIIIPLVMTVSGAFFMENAPSEINMIYGYRTEMSMKNKDTWKFAHKFCGRKGAQLLSELRIKRGGTWLKCLSGETIRKRFITIVAIFIGGDTLVVLGRLLGKGVSLCRATLTNILYP